VEWEELAVQAEALKQDPAEWAEAVVQAESCK
jgi:hypothetical protein